MGDRFGAELRLVLHQTHLNAGGAAEKGGSRGVLFPEDFVVLDEAHTVPEVATEHFGLRLSSYGTDRLLKYLFNPKTKRGLLQKHGGAIERHKDGDRCTAMFATTLAMAPRHPFGLTRSHKADRPA